MKSLKKKKKVDIKLSQLTISLYLQLFLYFKFSYCYFSTEDVLMSRSFRTASKEHLIKYIFCCFVDRCNSSDFGRSWLNKVLAR